MNWSLTTRRESAFNLFGEAAFAGVGVLVAGNALTHWAFSGFHSSMQWETVLVLIPGLACILAAVGWVFRPILGSFIGSLAALALLSFPASDLFGPRRPDAKAIEQALALEQATYDLARLQALLSGDVGSMRSMRQVSGRDQLDQRRRELQEAAEVQAAQARKRNTLLGGLFLSLALLGFVRFRIPTQKAGKEMDASRLLSTPQQRWEPSVGDMGVMLAVLAWLTTIAVRSPWLKLEDAEVYLLATASVCLLVGWVMSLKAFARERLRGCFTLALGVVALWSGWTGMIYRAVIYEASAQ
jgi:hypothetical protein